MLSSVVFACAFFSAVVVVVSGVSHLANKKHTFSLRLKIWYVCTKSGELAKHASSYLLCMMELLYIFFNLT